LRQAFIFADYPSFVASGVISGGTTSGGDSTGGLALGMLKSV